MPIIEELEKSLSDLCDVSSEYLASSVKRNDLLTKFSDVLDAAYKVARKYKHE